MQLYRDASELAGPVASYLADGFAEDEPAVVVVTPAHWPLVSAELGALGWTASDLERNGRLHVVDAEATLEAILEGGKPSAQLFEQVIGGALDRASGYDRAQNVRAFGEMVDLLCKRGDPGAARALEYLWNDLRTPRTLSLLCGYATDVFDRGAQVGLLPDVCRSHSHVVPASESDRLQKAVDRALVETLGAHDADKVYALVSTQVREQRVPASQLALMWVSAHMPKTSERILEAARAHYGDDTVAALA